MKTTWLLFGVAYLTTTALSVNTSATKSEVESTEEIVEVKSDDKDGFSMSISKLDRDAPEVAVYIILSLLFAMSLMVCFSCCSEKEKPEVGTWERAFHDREESLLDKKLENERDWR